MQTPIGSIKLSVNYSTLLSNPLLNDYRKCVFLDEDFSLKEKFTALGNLYFVHKTLDARIWDYSSKFKLTVAH